MEGWDVFREKPTSVVCGVVKKAVPVETVSDKVLAVLDKTIWEGGTIEEMQRHAEAVRDVSVNLIALLHEKGILSDDDITKILHI